MLNPEIIRKNPDMVRKNTAERNMDPALVDAWLQKDAERKKTLADVEDLNRKKNELANMGKQGVDVETIRAQGKEVKEASVKLEESLKTVEEEWLTLINQIPNLHLPDVKIGKTDTENEVAREVGEKPKFDFEPKDHFTLGTELGLLDFESGAKVAGSQFYFLKGDAVLLEFALIQFGLEILQSKGFQLVSTPDLAKSRYYLGTGYAPRGDEAQIYEIEGEDLGLIATAEVTMAGMHADEVLNLEQLPLKYAAISHCFRKEAGAYGKYSKGLYRVHQFTKLEMFVYCEPGQSEAIHQELLAVEEEIAQQLGIPYRVLNMCSGDLGASAAKKYDLEAWLPGRNDYGEITSTSNCTDFQARNLNIKYRNEEGKNDFAHMLNGTAIVMSRFPIAIMENYQQADGTIKIPEVLRKYFGNREFIGK
ncbi:MAG: serine--tRNA ligase [Candidatus Doudnabacteria bacterium]|nr:serine--tRNA ligase [Candidatus Doudnabacteria bacterium]